MKKKLYSLLLITTLCTGLIACGDTNTATTPTESASSEVATQAETESETQEQEPLIEVAMDLNVSKTFADGYHTLDIHAIRQIDKLETDAYTDAPADGNVYLIAFMTIENHTDDEDYISPYNVTTTLNGSDVIENTFLVNEPEDGYTTIFDNISALDEKNGFIVWEVPKDWQSLDVVFDNWKETHNTEITIHITPDLLFDDLNPAE